MYILVLLNSLEDHLQHLHLVMDSLRKAKLKLKPAKLKLKSAKCHFLRQSVEFLGHVITPQPNSRQTAAAQDFPVPQSLHQFRQFWG